MQEAEAAADAEANEEVENLLESYFMQIDRTFNRLKSLQEFMGCALGVLPPASVERPSMPCKPLCCSRGIAIQQRRYHCRQPTEC